MEYLNNQIKMQLECAKTSRAVEDLGIHYQNIITIADEYVKQNGLNALVLSQEQSMQLKQVEQAKQNALACLSNFDTTKDLMRQLFQGLPESIVKKSQNQNSYSINHTNNTTNNYTQTTYREHTNQK